MTKTFAEVTILGNVGEIEYYTTPDNFQIATFGIATQDNYTDYKSKVSWHRVVAKDTIVDLLKKTKLAKGDTVLITGKLISRKWETEDGEKRITVEVILSGYCAKFIKLNKFELEKSESICEFEKELIYF